MPKNTFAFAILLAASSFATPARAQQCWTESYDTCSSPEDGADEHVVNYYKTCNGMVIGATAICVYLKYHDETPGHCFGPDGCTGSFDCSCDDTGCDGAGDESSCGEPECSGNYISDPVHIGRGTFVTEPTEDVRFAGSDVPISFTRRYTTADAWSPTPAVHGNSLSMSPTRLARGWFHDYDERLFASDGAANVAFGWSTTFNVVHRGRAAAGQTFSCTSPGTAADFSCGALDGSLDRLQWVNSAAEWRIYQGADVVRFSSTGRLVGRAAYAACPRPVGAGSYSACALSNKQYWTVTYRGGTGAYAGNIDYVEDHLGRRLNFVWATYPAAGELIDKLTDSAGNVLVDFNYTGLLLTGVSSAAANETYEYLIDGANNSYPFITRVLRGAVPITTVAYSGLPSSGTPFRVRSVDAQDGSYAFRFANEPNNSCPNPSRTTQVIDRRSGTTTCSTDAACSASGQACDSGYCRPYTCQQYYQSGSDIDFSKPTNISGNCPCDGSSTRTYTSTSPRLVLTSTDRTGVVTSYAYDASHRLVARCVNDPDGSVSATVPTSCPSTGEYTTWTYGTVGTDVVHPSQVRFERRRSALSAGNMATTEYVYDVGTGQVLQIIERGYTRDLADATAIQTRTTSFQYTGAYGRLSAIVGAAGSRTEFEYWPTGSGANTGMLRYQREIVGSTNLTTTFANYTSLGMPQSVTLPSSASRSFTYGYQGMRLLSAQTANLDITFGYDAAGRVALIVEPTGRRTVINYGLLGRIDRLDVFDSSTSVAAERTTFTYDAGGRRTRTQVQRVSSTGALGGTIDDLQATYDSFGNPKTVTRGPQSPVTFTYDPAALAYLDQAQRGDGDLVNFQQDAFGRDTFFRRTFAPGSTGQHNFGYVTPAGVEVGAGLPTQVTGPTGRVRTYVYNDFGEVVRSDSQEWGTIRWRWQDGRLADTKWADGRRTAFDYDQPGRLVEIDNDADNPTQLGQDYRFYYDNGQASYPCPIDKCLYRKGRLVRVDVEWSPFNFWQLYYDYSQAGSVTWERWPDGRQTHYEWRKSEGDLVRMRFPASSQDYVRWDYDNVAGDNLDRSEVAQIIGERTTTGVSYVNWARSIQREPLGRLTSVLTHDASSTANMIAYRTDGRVHRPVARRRNGTGAITMLDRIYGYSADGSAVSHDSVVAGDAARKFFYDGANRLTCAATPESVTSCPTSGASLVESVSYNAADDRLTRTTPAGTTTYTAFSGGAAFYDEHPPGGRHIQYQSTISPAGGNRYSDNEATAGAPANSRTYTYDSQGRLRVVALTRPTGSPSSARESHVISILYDHRSQPIYVSDMNTSTTVEARWQYFYDLSDRLINRIEIPNAATTTTYNVDSYVYIDPLLIGQIRTQYVGGVGSEQLLYHVVSPEGVPQTGWTFNRTTFATAEAWRVQYGPFGTRIGATGDASLRPPHLFFGQIELPNSDATWWNGTSLFTSREPLYLNRWRVYDPRVGSYLQVDPFARSRSEVLSAYGYAESSPYDISDPEGRCPWCIPLVLACHASGACEALEAAVLGAIGGAFAAYAAADIARDIERGNTPWSPDPGPSPWNDPAPDTGSSGDTSFASRDDGVCTDGDSDADRCRDAYERCVQNPYRRGNHYGQSLCLDCFDICLLTGDWPTTNTAGVACPE